MLVWQCMVEPLQLRNLTWALTTTVACALFVQLARRKFLAKYLWFSLYVSSTIVQSALIAAVYWAFSVSDAWVWKIAWATHLETYHFAFLHKKTAGPLVYGNTSIADFYGDHALMTTTMKTIDKLREVPGIHKP